MDSGRTVLAADFWECAPGRGPTRAWTSIGSELISGGKVIAFLSDNHIDPDIAIESFVLESREDTTTTITPE